MLPHSGEKSRKYKTAMRPIRRAMATEANCTDTIKVIEIEPIMPMSAVCHEKYLKVGLK